MADETLSHFIWRTRYRDAQSGRERAIADTWDRVARSVAAVERDPGTWQTRFRDLLDGYRFLPAGRILAGAGTGRHVTLCNCFVMGLIEDSIPGIFEALKEGALTMQQGGGVGYDFSTLRPRGSRARSTGMIASGPVPFLQVWDATCATIQSTGARRGAMMATLRCDHPDIEEFIDAKRAAERLSHFNLSVLVTDEFMQAVAQDRSWPLIFPLASADAAAEGTVLRSWSGSPSAVVCRIYREVRARALWRRLCESAHASAEPGVLFIDRINADNNLGYVEQLSATNPCAEEPLPPYGACLLGSLNLTGFVRDPFTARARLDDTAIRASARTAVRFLDDAIEIAHFPLERQRDQARRSRRIGLGITGLADALAMLQLPYQSDGARQSAAALLQALRDAAYEASVELARERGAFELFDADRYGERPFIRRLPESLRRAIRRDGIRNSHLLAIAPAGTISLLADNISSGIEPIYELQFERRVLDHTGSHHVFRVSDPAHRLWRSLAPGNAPLPAFLGDQSTIPAQDQLLMQAALQPFVDGSISKTVALAAAADVDQVREIFESAYRLGLKGCTVFRIGSRSSILAHPACTGTRAAPQGPHCCETEREAD